MKRAFFTLLGILAFCVLCSLGCGRGIGKPCKSGGDCASSYCRDGYCFKAHEDWQPYIYVAPIYPHYK